MKINPHRYIILIIGILITTFAVVYHVLEQGGFYEPAHYFYNFPYAVAGIAVFGLFLIGASNSVDRYRVVKGSNPPPKNTRIVTSIEDVTDVAQELGYNPFAMSRDQWLHSVEVAMATKVRRST